MTRRLEATRLNNPSSVDRPDARMEHAETNGVFAASRRGLTSVDKAAVRPEHADGLQDIDRAGFSRSEGAGNGKSIDDMLNDFVTPSLTEPAILRRSVSILQRCISDVVPRLEGGDQLRELATSLMQDEIERHNELLGRMREGYES